MLPQRPDCRACAGTSPLGTIAGSGDACMEACMFPRMYASMQVCIYALGVFGRTAPRGAVKADLAQEAGAGVQQRKTKTPEMGALKVRMLMAIRCLGSDYGVGTDTRRQERIWLSSARSAQALRSQPQRQRQHRNTRYDQISSIENRSSGRCSTDPFALLGNPWSRPLVDFHEGALSVTILVGAMALLRQVLVGRGA